MLKTIKEITINSHKSCIFAKNLKFMGTDIHGFVEFRNKEKMRKNGILFHTMSYSLGETMLCFIF